MADIGNDATDRTHGLAAGYTVIDTVNPAAKVGRVSSIAIRAINTLDLVGCKVGIFSGSGANWTCKSVAELGTVIGGSAQSYAVDLGYVEIGDCIGIYYSSGLLEADSAGTLIYFSGDKCTIGDHSGGAESAYTMSVGGAIFAYLCDVFFIFRPNRDVSAAFRHNRDVELTFTRF